MEKFIKEIYEYSELYSELKQGILETRQMRMVFAEDHFNTAYNKLCVCCRECIKASCDYAMDFTQSVIQMSEYKNNLMLLSDHVEDNVLPWLKKWINDYAQIDVDTETGYRIVSSKVGYLTIQIVESGKYIHSLYDPMEEARQYINRIYEPEYREYILYGCGMGYYAYQIFRASFGAARITIYERDENLLNYARDYGVLDWIPDSTMTIKLIKSNTEFIEHSKQKGVKAVFHIAEMDSMPDFGKEELVRRCIGENTSNEMKRIAVMNYYRNLEQNIPDASEMKEKILPEAVVVAAGPSLDLSMDYLRMCKGKKSIIAVNTIFRKLIKNGIEPDFVVVIDASERMEKHLEGVENEKVPLIIDLCGYWRWCRDYLGPKYMVYSTFGCKEAEAYIKQNKKEKWPSGGTVTFLAMEFAYRMGAKKIYFVGTDLGYPEGKSHATGTAYGMELNTERMVEVNRVGGGKILTDHVMNQYRNAIEIRISQIGSKVKFYNLSTIGARIKGTIELKEM